MVRGMLLSVLFLCLLGVTPSFAQQGSLEALTKTVQENNDQIKLLKEQVEALKTSFAKYAAQNVVYIPVQNASCRASGDCGPAAAAVCSPSGATALGGPLMDNGFIAVCKLK